MQRFLQGRELPGSCFYEQKHFLLLFKSALPAVDRSEIRNEVDAGGETALDECMRQLAGFLWRACGREDDSDKSGFAHALLQLYLLQLNYDSGVD